jgi:hypothetical protein
VVRGPVVPVRIFFVHPDQPRRIIARLFVMGGTNVQLSFCQAPQSGFVANFTDDAANGDQREAYKQTEFEKRFFSKATNQLFCKTFLENALRDPVSGEIGKSIVFAVSQNHAAKLAHTAP